MNILQYKVIGYPARHSLSPTIHNTLYKIYDIPGKYTFSEIEPSELKVFVDRVKNELCGMNVTMPFKNEIIKYLDVNHAKYSVNTVKILNGRLIGHSTDEFGFTAALNETGCDIKNKKIVFLGAGAVTKALSFHIKNCGADVCILNRTIEKARELATQFKIKYGEFLNEEFLSEADVIVNATPLGMINGKNFEDFSFLDILKKDTIVFDLNYSKKQTELEKNAEKRGLYAINGLSMLIWQAFGSFDIFFGIKPTVKDKEFIYNSIINI